MLYLSILLASSLVAGIDNPTPHDPIKMVHLILPPGNNPVITNIADLFERHVTARCPARVTLTEDAPLTVVLEFASTPPGESYAITENDPGTIHIQSESARGLLYGIGKLLRDSRYSSDGFTPGDWRGVSTPGKAIRGIYFATHFHNYYHDAPLTEVQRYIEDLALWGVNTLIVWYDMHHFNGWDDPEAVLFRTRLHEICSAARNAGMDIGFGVVANEGYGNSPVELRADMGGMRGAKMPTDICTSKPEGQRYVLDNFAQLFDWASGLHPAYAWIWPYDSGGCGCAGCQPWGHGGFLRAAKPLAELIKSKAPSAKIILSTWFFDAAEWAGLSKQFATPPEWANILLAEPHSPAFTSETPGQLPLTGFPEISMNGMWPWGGFGANPQPSACVVYWNTVKDKVIGCFPYSEGVYEDINKVIFTQLLWNPEREVKDILKEYIAFEFSPDVINDVLSVIQILDANHHFRWWPGLLEDYKGWFPSKGTTPQDDPGAEEAYATVKNIDARLAPWARTSWRWRILYLRALLDSELKGNGGRPTEACEQAFEELTRIYHAENALIDLAPPSTTSPASINEDLNITNIAAGISKTNLVTASTHIVDVSQTWLPEFRPIPENRDGCEIINLDGVWRFNPIAPEESEVWGLDGPGWQDVLVPGQWANQGIVTADTSTVAIGTDFEIPSSFSGKRLFLRFDAIQGGTTYWLNGQKLGHTEYYYCPVEYDVTKMARPGEINHLRMTQTRNLFADTIQFDGYRRQGNPPETGILRSIRLFTLPTVHVASVHINTGLDKDYKDAQLLIDLVLDNPCSNPKENISMNLGLRDSSGSVVSIANSQINVATLTPGKVHIQHTLYVPDPKKWNAETPHLYTLEIVLQQNGNTLEQITQTVGFREIEIKGSQILINGKPIKLHGLCHHEYDPVTKRSGTAKHAVADVLLMKYANVNYCRTTHYPPTKEFLDACDRYGIYVEVEAPFMWTRFVPGEDDPVFAQKFLDPTAAMLEYHRNHPSVFMWSLANESGFEPWHQPNRLPVNYQATHKFLKKMDPSRLTNFHNEWDDDGRTTDIGNLHYVTPPYESSPWIADDTRPILLGEMYLLVGSWKQPYLDLDPGIREYWAMENNCHWFNHMQKLSPAQELWTTPQGHPRGQNNPGSGYNQSFWSEKIAGLSIWEAVGSHGIIDDWRRPKTEWWIVKRMFSPIQIPIREVPFDIGQTSVTLPIENRYAFTDLSGIKLTWEIADTGVIAVTGPPSNAQEFNVQLLPMTQGSVNLLLPEKTIPGQLLIIRATHPDGHLITATGVQLGSRQTEKTITLSDDPPTWRDDGATISIQGEDFGLVIIHTTGFISSTTGTTSPVLAEFPSIYALSHWNQEPMLSSITHLPGQQKRFIDELSISDSSGTVTILMKDHSPNFTGHVQMNCDKHGNARFDYQYTYSGKPFKAGEVGLCLPLTTDCRRIEWNRSTEWDVYPSDHIGRPVGTAWANHDPQMAPPANGYMYPIIPGGNPNSLPWPCSQDSTLFGTDDFRATKYHIHQARLSNEFGGSIHAAAECDVNARACLQNGKVLFNLWKSDTDGLQLSDGSTVAGTFMISLHNK